MTELLPAPTDLSEAAIWRRAFDENYYLLPDDMVGMAVVDVGAHVGGFSAACLKRGATVLAAEPCFATHSTLCNAVWPWRERATVERVAVGGSSGYAHLHHNPEHSCAHSTHWHQSGLGEDVEQVTLAQLCDNLERIDLLKMNCEGAEYEIVAGSAAVLERCGALAVEVHKYVRGPEQQRALRATLERCGLTIKMERRYQWNDVLFCARPGGVYWGLK